MFRGKFVFDLSERRYRALVYLLASAVINFTFLFSLWGVYRDYFFFYVNWFGLLLLLLFFGRPHMYSGWYDPNSILAPVLLVFGFFLEIFVVCELAIYIKKKVS